MTCPPFCQQCGGNLGHPANGDWTCAKCKRDNGEKTMFNQEELALLYVALRTQIPLEIRRHGNDRHAAVVKLERLRIKIGELQCH